MIKQLHSRLRQRVELEKLSFWKLFALQAVLFFAIYGIMLVPRFSTDAYSVYFYSGDGLGGFLELGRIGTFLLYKALLALGVNSVTMSPFFTAVFCLTIAWSSAVFLSKLTAYFPYMNWLTFLFVEFAVVLAYANIYFAELFFFSDVALMYTFNIFFMTLALCFFFHRNRIAGVVLSLICLCCSLSFYQASLGMFMILSSVLVLLKHDVLWPRPEKRSAVPLLRELFCLLVAGGGASVANLLTLNILSSVGFYSNRSPSLHLADILGSIRQMVSQYSFYYSWGYPSYLTGILKVIFIISGPALLFIMADSFDRHSKKRYPLSSIVITLLVLIANLLLVLSPHFLSKNVWIPPRSIFSFFALFSFMSIITGYNHGREGTGVSLAVLAVMLILVGANIAVIQRIALDQIELNHLDRLEAEAIVEYIRAYEEDSGQTVETISWRSDGNYTWTYPEIKYTFMDMNIRAGGRSWSLTDCIGYYAGRRFRSEQMPDERWALYFQDKSWDAFEIEEQIRFEGSTMYLMTY